MKFVNWRMWTAVFLVFGNVFPVWAWDSLSQNNVFSISPHPKSDASFQLARLVFLPDIKDSEIDFSYEAKPINICSSYSLSVCPDNAICSKCEESIISARYKIDACKDGYIPNDTDMPTECIVFQCRFLGNEYLEEIPDNKICDKIVKYGKNCYSNCKDISCAGYSISCLYLPPFSTSVTRCPDCLSDDANCGTDFCKISQCKDGYKIAENGTKCIELDDTCPDGYFKECETGIETTVEPQTTEAGSLCYKCKPEVVNCPTGQLNLENYWCNGALRCLLPKIN